MNKALYFYEFINEEEPASHNDYPAQASKNAQKVIAWKEQYGRDQVKGGSEVGWKRANQLAKGEPLSLDTIKRMKAFFDRHTKNKELKPEYKDKPWKDNGYVAWLLWGGDAAKKWCEDKLQKHNQ